MLAALGCGARAEVGGAGDGGRAATPREGAAASESRDGTGGTRSRSVAPDPGSTIDLVGTTLPECRPGFPLSSAGTRECSYIFDGRCHEEALDACACACRGAANRCVISGFLDSDEPQLVTCIAG
jgi:hypothetical protein